MFIIIILGYILFINMFLVMSPYNYEKKNAALYAILQTNYRREMRVVRINKESNQHSEYKLNF